MSAVGRKSRHRPGGSARRRMTQEPGRAYRLGVLIPAPRQTPAVLALFDELRLNGFIKAQNLVVLQMATNYVAVRGFFLHWLIRDFLGHTA